MELPPFQNLSQLARRMRQSHGHEWSCYLLAKLDGVCVRGWGRGWGRYQGGKGPSGVVCEAGRALGVGHVRPLLARQGAILGRLVQLGQARQLCRGFAGGLAVTCRHRAHTNLPLPTIRRNTLHFWEQLTNARRLELRSAPRAGRKIRDGHRLHTIPAAPSLLHRRTVSPGCRDSHEHVQLTALMQRKGLTGCRRMLSWVLARWTRRRKASTSK